MSEFAMLRPSPCRIHFAEFRADLRTGELLKGDSRIPLQKQPFEILSVLLKRAGELVSRDELQHAIFDDGVNVDFEHSVNRSMNKLRSALGDSADHPKMIETLPGRGYRFIAPIIVEDHAISGSRHLSPAMVQGQIPIPCRGALPLDSPFYIEREVDAKVHMAIYAEDSVVLLKGARQTGKTSLLARAFALQRSHGERTVISDLQKMGLDTICDINAFLRALAGLLADSLELDIDIEANWESRRSASNNFERFLRCVLGENGKRLVWGIDEADRLFPRPYATEFFGLLRAWHNERALDPDSRWQRLTLVIAYATEAHLFISDVNQSPFNVGTKFELLDFTLKQITDLGACYGVSMSEAVASNLHELVGGHPYLLQRALYELVTRQCSPTELAEVAANEDGPFAEHLRHLLLTLEARPELLQSMRHVLARSGTLATDHFYRLRAFGILAGDRARNAVPRCRLYRDYLGRHLI